MYGKKDRLQKHVNVCRHIPPNVRQEFLTKLPHEDVIETTGVKRKQLDENEQKSIDCLIVKGIALKNIPFSSFLENYYLNLAFNALGATLPSPMRAKDTLSQLATKYYLSTKEDLSKHKDWTISCDGTTDVTKIATYVFNISRAGSQHYLKIVDLSAQRHSAEELAQSVEDTLSDYDINLNHVIAVATDNTGNVTSMKELLQQKSDGRIIPIKCFLHWLNLIVKDIMGCFKLLVLEKNCRIISFIHRSTLWSNAVKIKSKEYSIKHGLSSFCETRWYSVKRHAMLRSTIVQTKQ
jgi:hypothetical protein